MSNAWDVEDAIDQMIRTQPEFFFSLALLVTQATLTTVALVLASLFVRSLRYAQTIDPGFDADHVAIVSFDLGMLRYDNTAPHSSGASMTSCAPFPA
jgi:hypothetical protein